MESFDDFREMLRDALGHLHDPEYCPPALLCRIAGSLSDGAGPVQVALVSAIRQLAPDPESSPESRTWLYFGALHRRFVEGLTQEETADALHMSVRNVQRIQGEAIHVLAQRLWEQALLRSEPAEPVQALDWRTQADREIASLGGNTLQAPTIVADVIQGVIELEAALSRERGVAVTLGFVQDGLLAATHPSVLRQTLITAIGRLAPHVFPAEIVLYAMLEDGDVKVTLSGSLAAHTTLSAPKLLADIITPPDARLELHHRGDRVFLQVLLPAVGERTVLVVEDNPDMVYFYRRCTAGTRYRIVHVEAARDLFTVIAQTDPDVIVLDVMLPDIDGWQLLTHLHERPVTRDIPVIICSVVKEETLALALGATAFLSKPIRPGVLVAALDQALLQVPERGGTVPKSTAAVV
jgi:CheY-like chemotaxis protein